MAEVIPFPASPRTSTDDWHEPLRAWMLDVVADRRLPQRARVVACALVVTFAGRRAVEIQPNLDEVAHAVAVPRAALPRILRALERTGWIDRQRGAAQPGRVHIGFCLRPTRDRCAHV